MKTFRQTAINASASLLCALLLPCAGAWADIDISRTPVFVNDSVPP
ncbi:hypothetical protein [Pseudomonas sp. 273]|nr:hypothetical protein [Pseudomonas sp. 273]